MGKGKNVAIGALIAGAAGYVAGILTAPKSGKETRKDIADTAVKVKSEAEKKLKKLHGDLEIRIADAKKRALTLSSSAKQELESLVSRAVVAKEKARHMLSAFHEGETDDKDLEKVLKEVSAALEDLKAYVASDDKKAK